MDSIGLSQQSFIAFMSKTALTLVHECALMPSCGCIDQIQQISRRSRVSDVTTDILQLEAFLPTLPYIHNPMAWLLTLVQAIHPPPLRPTNSDTRRPTAMIPLRRQNLIVMRTKFLPILGPRIEMVLDGDGAAHALARPHTPELLEGGGSVNGGLVGARGLEDVVGTTVGGDRALLLSSRGGVVATVCLYDVVLDERVAGLC